MSFNMSLSMAPSNTSYRGRPTSRGRMFVGGFVVSDRLLYAAFGSNMDPVQMDERAPRAVAVATGYLVDYRLRFCRFADVVPSPGSRVPVVIWSLTCECMWALDAYEGVPFTYVRDQAPVFVETIDYPVSCLLRGRIALMMIYRMRRRFRPAPPPLGYLNRILAAYDIWGFDSDLVWEAFLSAAENSEDQMS